MANYGAKPQQVEEEAIAKTLLVCLNNQEQKNQARFQAFLQEF